MNLSKDVGDLQLGDEKVTLNHLGRDILKGVERNF